MLVQSKAMMNEINSLEKTPNTKHHMNDLILATNNVYEKVFKTWFNIFYKIFL